MDRRPAAGRGIKSPPVARELSGRLLRSVLDREEVIILYVFRGLPGAGKSTLPAAWTQEIRGVYLQVDGVEQALRMAHV